MKKTGLILLLALAIPYLGWSQASHKAVINSQGGGPATGGTTYHYGVVGQQVQTITVGEFGQNQDPAKQVTLSVGFLQAAAANPAVVPPCLVPFGLQVSQLGQDNATIGWSVEAGAIYEYRYKELASANFEVFSPNTHISSATLNDLLPGTDYIFQLRKQCAEEEFTNWTEEFRFKTLGNPPCETPSSVNVAIATSNVTVSWLASPTAPQTYIMRYRLTGAEEWLVSTDESLNLSRTITGLTPGIYQVQVGVTCSGVANAVFGSSILFQVPNPCTAPSLNLTSASSSSLTVGWSGSNYESVNLRYRLRGTFSDWTTLANLTDPSTVITGLLDGEDYEISIQATCGEASVSSWSPLLFARTEGEICPVPSSLTVSNIGQNGATITWIVSTDSEQYDIATNYEVLYREKGTAATISVEVTNTHIQLNSLLPGRTYVLQVRSKCSDDSPGSVFSQTIEFTTEASPVVCAVPTGINVETSGTTATLAWTPNDAIGYEVWFRRSNATVWNIRMAENPELTLHGLVDGATYVYQVRSICGAAGDVLSAWSPQASFTMPTTFSCTTPTGVTATTGDEGEINIAWIAVTGASNYRLRYRVIGASFWSNMTTSGSSQLLQGLEPGVDYEVALATVCSTDGSVFSPFSAIQTVRAGGISTCNVPTAVAITAIEGGMNLSWSSTADNYLIRYRLLETTQWTFVESANTEINLVGLQGGMTYQYQIRSACTANLSSDFTLLAEFTTDAGAATCDLPMLAANATVTNNSINVSWANATGALGYNLQFRVDGTNVWTSRQVGSPSFTATSLLPGTTYQFRVQSVCDEDGILVSQYSAIRTYSTTGTANCVAPTAISVVPTENSATIAWANAAGGQFTQIRYRELGQLTAQLVNSAVGASLVDITGLKSGATYIYQVRTICDQDNFQASTFTPEAQFTTLGLPCLVPVPQVVGEPGVATTISWQMQEGSDAAEQFRYLYRANGATTWTTGDTPSTSVSLTGLATGVTYQFMVQSRCSVAGNKSSLFSDLIFFTVPGEPTCLVPTGLQATQITTNNATLNWDGNGQNSFDLQYRIKGATTNWVTTFNIVNTSFELSNLSPNAEYEWRVRAKCDGIVTAFSIVSFFNTPSLSGRFIAEEEVTASSELDIEKLTIADLHVEAYPNPFLDWLNLRITSPMETWVTVSLYNMAGQKLIDIFEGVLAADAEQEYKVDGSQLGSGMYLIILRGDDDQRIVKKVIR